jgi:hypothetical protein
VKARLVATRGRPAVEGWEGDTLDLSPAASGAAALEIVVVLAPAQLAALADRVADVIDQRRDDGFIDVDGAARFLGDCSRAAVYHVVERDRIRSHRLGGRLLFDPAEIREDVNHDRSSL